MKTCRLGLLQRTGNLNARRWALLIEKLLKQDSRECQAEMFSTSFRNQISCYVYYLLQYVDSSQLRQAYMVVHCKALSTTQMNCFQTIAPEDTTVTVFGLNQVHYHTFSFAAQNIQRRERYFKSGCKNIQCFLIFHD